MKKYVSILLPLLITSVTFSSDSSTSTITTTIEIPVQQSAFENRTPDNLDFQKIIDQREEEKRIYKDCPYFQEFVAIKVTPFEEVCDMANRSPITNQDNNIIYANTKERLKEINKKHQLSSIINKQSAYDLYNTPLQIALKNFNWPVIVALIELGANPEAANRQNESAYDIAVSLDKNIDDKELNEKGQGPIEYSFEKCIARGRELQRRHRRLSNN